MRIVAKCSYVMIFTALLLMTISSCVPQPIDPVYRGVKGVLPVAFKSGNGISVSGDDEVRTVRCVVFTESNRLVSNALYDINGGEKPWLVPVEVAVGRNDFYIICNETPGLKRQLEGVSSPQQIEAIRFVPPIEGMQSPVPMFAQILGTQVTRTAAGLINVEVSGVVSTILDVVVKRIVAKLGMTVIKNIPTEDRQFSIEKLTYRLNRLPKYSPLVEGGFYPHGDGWGPEVSVEGQGRIAMQSNGDYNIENGVCTVPEGIDAIRFSPQYIPEHILENSEDESYCTYMIIDAECITSSSPQPIHTIYKFNLGKLPPVNLNLERNVNYQVYATIRGMGATGFYAEIVPVEEYDLPITWIPFEGYAIVGERVADYGSNVNIWNSYSQYSGILKIIKNKSYYDACFRYGSVVALSETSTAGAFNPSSDVLWMPEVTKADNNISSWEDVPYLTSGDVMGVNHNLASIKQGKGDPCRLVGLSESEIESGIFDNELWRLPTKEEMQWLETAKNYTFDSRGFYSFSHLLTPFNGYRAENGQMVPKDASAGHYWSSTDVNSFVFGQNNVSVLAADNAQKAYAVRCIRNEIPESLFDAGSFMAEYSGGTGPLWIQAGTTLVPHWRMELANSADTAFLSIEKREGGIKDINMVTVKPAVNPYKTYSYEVLAKGYGLDGKVHEKTLIVEQRALNHKVEIFWSANSELSMVNGFYRIPREGLELDFSITVTPDPYVAFYPNVNTMLWRIECRYFTDKLNVEYGSSAVTGGVSKIVIKPNNWGHILGLEFKMVPVTLPYFPHLSGLNVLVQELK